MTLSVREKDLRGKIKRAKKISIFIEALDAYVKIPKEEAIRLGRLEALGEVNRLIAEIRRDERSGEKRLYLIPRNLF